MQNQIRASLRYTDDYLFVNEGYWKPNLSWHVYYMQGSDSSVGEIIYMLPPNLTSTSRLPLTIIFVDQRGLAFEILKTLLEYLPPELASKVEIYHALQSQLAKDIIAEKFAKGLICILICTEALTMASDSRLTGGCDFRNIEQVIMFKVPSTLPTVLQRGGRGGRNEKIWCRVVLMVEASKHKLATAKPINTVVKSKEIKTENRDSLTEGVDEVAAATEVGSDGPEVDEPDEQTRDAIRVTSLEHGKQDEAYLKLFYEPTDRCRTSVLDEAFCSPEHPPCISVNGCDNCIRRRIIELEAKGGSVEHQDPSPVKQEPVEDDSDILSDTPNIPDTISELRKLLIEPRPKQQLPKPKERAQYRPTDERGVLEELLTIWRRSVYQLDCKGLGINANHIITDQTIAVIARILPPITIHSLSKTTPPWPKKARTRWGTSLLDIIHNFDLPVNADERKMERVRLRKEARMLRATQGMDAAKSEGNVPELKATKRGVGSSELASPGAAKRQRTQSDTVTNAESATNTGPQTQQGFVPLPRSNAQPPGTPTRASTSKSSAHTMMLRTPTGSDTTQASPKSWTPARQSPHYRPHTYHPIISSPLLPHSSKTSSQGLEQTTQPGTQAPHPVGTILIQRPINSISGSPSSVSDRISTPITPSNPTPTTSNPKARSRYYGDHLYGPD
ncbi:hypothetical protein FRC11_010989 [Ceratobasidium sp. 423]|nr:hypothetical protein FRC11_010989 [Ceratobasidium sp. 423]